MRWRTRLAVSGFAVQIGRSTSSTAAVSTVCTSSAPSRDRRRLRACAPLRRMLRIAPAGPLALDQRLGRGLEGERPDAAPPANGSRPSLTSRGPRAPSRVPGQRDLGIGAEPHVTAAAIELVAQHPGAGAARLHHQHEPLHAAVAVPARPGRLRLSIRQSAHGHSLYPHPYHTETWITAVMWGWQWSMLDEHAC